MYGFHGSIKLFTDLLGRITLPPGVSDKEGNHLDCHEAFQDTLSRLHLYELPISGANLNEQLAWDEFEEARSLYLYRAMIVEESKSASRDAMNELLSGLAFLACAFTLGALSLLFV